ncbi:MAG: phosphatidate cytidylyltransferase [Treponema sp.]|nr:phosphatidate cytidylyltransferase [Treponema sp.]
MESGQKNLEEIPAELLQDRRKSELLRKSLHFLIAFVPILAGINRYFTLILLASGTLAYGLMEYLRQRGVSIPLISRLTVAASRRRDMGRFVLGPVTLGLGAFLPLLIYPLPFASIAIYALAFGDGTASLAGKFIGRLRPSFLFGKSVEGSVACFLGTFLSVWFYTIITGNGNIFIALLAACTAVVTELIPLRDWDNIIIPMAVGGLVWLIY